MTGIDFTVSDLAKQLQRSRSKIVGLITSGRLVAYDAAPDGAYRQWRVMPEALQKFREQNRPQPVTKRRKAITKPIRRFV